MKRLIYLLCSLTLLTLLQSCNKDEMETTPDLQLAEEVNPLTKRTCNHEYHMDQLLSDPEYKRMHEAKFTRLNTMAQNRSATCNSPTILPVAIHFQGVNNPNLSCLRQLAENQMAIVNADFQGSNGDISKWTNGAASSFPGINNGEACFEFCIATRNHPSGYGLSDGDLAVTVNKTNGDEDNAWSGYINIFVRGNLGFLGEAPLGGRGNGDGVLVDATAFGSSAGCGSVSPQAPFDKGRTLTHEIGHYLLLEHIWGNGCGSDDLVADTPNSRDAYYDCPNVGASSCSSIDMHMNYMDYTNDECMYMFSAGQVSRAENYISTSLQNVVSKAASVCDSGGGGNTPTCTDGVQNGDETGVDCGGSCSPCETTPTCTDGVQNGDETGVDCGGSCSPCETNAPCSTPENVSLEVNNETKVTITWNAVSSAVKYNVRYREVGTSQWIWRTTTSTSRALTNLFSDATYEYQVRTKCDSKNSPWASKREFTTASEEKQCINMSVLIQFDEYSDETSWELFDEDGNVVAKGENYGNKREGQRIRKRLCVPQGCYTFVIYDEYGDGICCDYGRGFYRLINDDTGEDIYRSNGRFGYEEEVEWCFDNGANRQASAEQSLPKHTLQMKPRHRIK